jgi:hypothetical protein
LTTNLPAALDNWTNPVTTDLITSPTVGLVKLLGDHNDAIEYIEQILFGSPINAATSVLNRITTLEAGAITFVEADGSPSLKRKVLRVGGQLTDVDADIALLEWGVTQLKDWVGGPLSGKGGYALQVNTAGNGVDLVAPYDIESLSGGQLVIALDAPNSRVTMAVSPPAPIVIPWSTAPFTSSVAIAAGVTEWPNNNRRRKTVLTNALQARMSVMMGSTAFTAGTVLGVQYSLDGTSGWTYLDGATGPNVAVSAANTCAAGAWVNLAALAKADVYLRLVGQGGTGTIEAASVGTIELQVR